MTDLDSGAITRQAAWIEGLGSDEYAPISRVPVVKLEPGNIVDVRDFGIEDVEPENAYLTIESIKSDEKGVHGFSGRLPNGTMLTVIRAGGTPYLRRKCVRFTRREND